MLQRERFIVTVQDPNETITQHRVVIHHQDMLRGELENSRQGNPDGARLNLVTAWCWAAMTRDGLCTTPYEHWRDFALVGLEDDGSETVDPTPPPTPDASG